MSSFIADGESRSVLTCSVRHDAHSATCFITLSFQPMPGTTHSIGTLWFPGDGALWVSVGEGNIHDGGFWTGTFGYVGTDRALAMDPDFLGGKILRIDPDTGRGYPDNPWCDGNLNRARCKAWASGLRNPFRCAGGPGAVRCGDVGWYTIESYKMLYKGQNSGWPCYEGTTIPPGANGATQICQRIYNGDSPYGPVRTGVLYQWNHNGGSAAAIGGVQIPAFYPDVGGRWIVADYVSGNVWAMAGGDARTFFTNADGPASFRVGADGFLYYIRNPEGTLIRLRVEGHTPAPDPTIPKATTSRPRIPKTTRPADPLCNPTRRIVVPECTVNKGEDPLEPVQYLSREGWPQSRRRFVRNGLWSTVGLDTSVGNRTVNSGRTLSIAGTYYLTGFGTHAASIIEMSLNKCCYRFTGLVGVDDEVGRFYPWWRNASLATVGGGEFTVKDASPGRASDKVLWNSTRARPYMRIRYGTKAIPFNIKRLGGISKIRLEARVPARLAEIKYSDYTAAHLDWVEPKLYCGPRAPYAPIINLVTPPEGFIAKPGANVKFSATATYWDGTTPIPGGKMFWKWWVVWNRDECCSRHPSTVFPPVLTHLSSQGR